MRLDNVDPLISVLNSLLLAKETIVYLHVLPAGLKLTVERNKLVFAKAYLKASLFAEYTFQKGSGRVHDEHEELDHSLPDTIISHGNDLASVNSSSFGLPLNRFLAALRIFSPNAHCSIRVPADRQCIELILEEGGVISECILTCIESTESDDIRLSDELNIRSAPIIARAVAKSTHLKLAFAEVDIPGAQLVHIKFNAENPPYLEIMTRNEALSINVNLPFSATTDVFTDLSADENVEYFYHLSLLRPCLKVLQHADHTYIRINQNGMLSLQHILPTHDERITNWIEFTICAHDPHEDNGLMVSTQSQDSFDFD